MTDGEIEDYVRLDKGHDDEPDRSVRELSFQIPPEMTQQELLEHGFAIDGDSAYESVSSYYDEHPNEQRLVPMAEALHDEQLRLTKLLGKLGYRVVFA